MKNRFKPLLLAFATIAALSGTVCAQEGPDPDRLRKEANELMEKARDLKAHGNFEASDKLARESKELQRKAESITENRREPERAEPERGLNQGPARERMSPDRPNREPRLAPPAERRQERVELFQLEQRQRHLKKAIFHLHAAGLHEQAERLEQRLDLAKERIRAQRRQSLERPSPRRGAERPADRNRGEQREP
jgi:hypothetical protein